MSRSEAHSQRNEAMRQAFANPWDIVANAPGTAQVIPDVCKKVGIEHSVEEIPQSIQRAKLHWLGKRDAGKTLLYFHGGGFVLPIFEGHVKFLGKTIEKVKESGGVDMNVAVLEYALAPNAKFPVQITQGAQALHYLLEQGLKPSNIIIGGDSAGGNLVLSIFSTILHGFEGIKPFNLEEEFAGALLISPWASLGTDAESMKTNDSRDVPCAKNIDWYTDLYAGGAARNNYLEPIRADATWWKNFPAKRILNVYGEYEIFVSDIVKLGRSLKDAGTSVETVECEKHVHIDAILDEQVGLPSGEMAHRVWQWLGEAF